MNRPMACPVCGKQAKTGKAVDCARHMFGTGDKAHRAWVEAQGLSFIDLLIEQATTPGNRSYLLLAEVIEKAQNQPNPAPPVKDDPEKPSQGRRDG